MHIVISRRASEEVIRIDCSKIIAAIDKAFDTILRIRMEEAFHNIAHALLEPKYTQEEYAALYADRLLSPSDKFLHGLVSILMHCMSLIYDTVYSLITYDPCPAVRYAAITYSGIKSLTLESLGHISDLRRSRLLRRQDRGSKEPVSEDDNNTYILKLS